MPKNNSLPVYNSVPELRQIYYKLSAPPTTHYKSLVKVYLKFGFYIVAVVHTEQDNVNLTKKGYRNARKVEPVYTTNGNGEKVPVQFKYVSMGSLYGPQSTLSFGAMDFEWALVFKIDCDLAREKTGDIQDALVQYAQKSSLTPEQLEKRKNFKQKRQRNPAGRPPRKSNSTDLLDRYGNDETARAWIEANQDKLNAAHFTHDDYLDSVMQNSVSLSDQKDLI